MKNRHESALTDALSQVELVTLAVYLLGGDSQAIDTEDIAVKVHSLAPSRFSWRKHPEQINLELVRVYLSDAKKATNGSLLAGSGRTGWSLTPSGLEWASQASTSLDDMDLTRSRAETRAGSLDETRWRRERGRIETTEAWQRWQAGEDPDVSQAEGVFRIDTYAVGRMRTMKVTRLQALFKDDPEIAQFLKAMADLVLDEGASE